MRAMRSICPNRTAQRVKGHQWYDNTLPVIIRIPCDTAMLARSSALPPSIYTTTDTLFDAHERDVFVNDALNLSRQADWEAQPASASYGLSETRYNRIEGLATAVAAKQIYGAGYAGYWLLRLGFADLSPTGELALSRSDGRETITLGAYRRLAAANDWSDPFSLGASLSALLFGRDDGIYYRTWGTELTHTQTGGFFDTWKLFAERQSDATPRATFSIPNAFGRHRFRGNIDAMDGSFVGLALERRGTLGEDPSSLRAFSDIKVEGATGSYDYVRGMMDVTLTHPVPAGLSGAMTFSGGTSGGHLTSQRLWYVSGPYTVRGQPIGTAVGNAYWVTRVELGSNSTGFKPFLFADIGWAGDRTQWTTNVNIDPSDPRPIYIQIVDEVRCATCAWTNRFNKVQLSSYTIG